MSTPSNPQRAGAEPQAAAEGRPEGSPGLLLGLGWAVVAYGLVFGAAFSAFAIGARERAFGTREFITDVGLPALLALLAAAQILAGFGLLRRWPAARKASQGLAFGVVVVAGLLFAAEMIESGGAFEGIEVFVALAAAAAAVGLNFALNAPGVKAALGEDSFGRSRPESPTDRGE